MSIPVRNAPPSSWRPGHRKPPSSRGGAANAEHVRAKRPLRGSLLGSVPVVRKSFVVELVASEGDAEVTAHIRPTEQAATALVSEGFRLSESVLDFVSDLLVEIAQEDDEA